MKVILVYLTFFVSYAFGQKIDTLYSLKSVPIYDQDGNSHTYVQNYDHLPTAEDTASFLAKGYGVITKEWEEQSKKLFDDFMKEYNQMHPPESSKMRKKVDVKPKKKN